jgi:hypothetical protein
LTFFNTIFLTSIFSPPWGIGEEEAVKFPHPLGCTEIIPPPPPQDWRIAKLQAEGN